MSTRFKNTLYTLGDYKHVDGHIRYVTNEDGTLFSGHYRTKIKPEATRCSPNSANKKLYGASVSRARQKSSFQWTANLPYDIMNDIMQ